MPDRFDDATIFDDLQRPSCRVTCECPTIAGPLMADGNINLDAFALHIFCRSCKVELELDTCPDDWTIDGADLEVAWHATCPSCGNGVYATVSHAEADTPPGLVPPTEAQRRAAKNRSWRESIHNNEED